jgi:hypothetical protein
MKTSKTTREITLVDVPCEIEYTYYKGCKGARDGRFGPPLEPDDPPEVEIISVMYEGHEMINNVTTDYIDELATEILDDIERDKK